MPPIYLTLPYLPGYLKSSGGGIYTGTGADGVVIIDSPITLARDMHYHNVIITGAGSVDVNGYMFFADGYLDLTTAGINAIHANGYNGSGMGAGGGRTAHTIGGSSAGGAGARNATPYAPYFDGSLVAFNGSNGNNVYYSNGGAGAVGGAGGQSSAYIGSGQTLGGATSQNHLYTNYNRYMTYDPPTNSILTNGGAGGGGGGSGAGVALSESYLLGGYGGGGGGGGGVVGIFVEQLRIDSSGTTAGALSAVGGAGAIGGSASGAYEGPTYYFSGPGGGGGTGGGGFVYLGYNSKSGSKSNLINITGAQNGGGAVLNGATMSIVTSALHGTAYLSI